MGSAQPTWFFRWNLVLEPVRPTKDSYLWSHIQPISIIFTTWFPKLLYLSFTFFANLKPRSQGSPLWLKTSGESIKKPRNLHDKLRGCRIANLLLRCFMWMFGWAKTTPEASTPKLEEHLEVWRVHLILLKPDSCCFFNLFKDITCPLDK